MIKIKALNEPSSPVEEDFDEQDRTPVTKEAQEEHLLSLYFGALRQIDSDPELAKEKLNDLLAHLNRLDKDHGLSNVEHLKYLALKNLGLIIPDSLTFFVDALCLDGRDVTLWIETGKRALDHFLNLPLARYCFEQALSISRNNWIAIDSLVDIYYMLNDYRNCFDLCLKALEFAPDYSKAHFLISEIVKGSASLRKELPISLQWIVDWKPPEKSLKILECYQAIKDRRKRKFIEDQEKIERKRQKLAINLDTLSLSLSSLGVQVQKICNDIRKHHISMNSPVSIICESRADEISSTDESVSDDNVEKERCKPKMKGSQEFPFEFVDKRRSSRVQRNQSRSNDSSEITNDGIFGKVSSLFPNFATGMEEELKLSQTKISKPSDQSVENRIVEQFINRQKAFKRSSRRISAIIDDLIFAISTNSCAIKVPSYFTEFYSIHRSLNELPSPTIAEIGSNVSLDELKLILTALEVEYSNKDSVYLTQMLIHLETAMTPEEYDNFFLRLLIQRGCKESRQDLISEAIDYMDLKQINNVLASNKVVYQPNLLRSMQNSLTENSLSVLLDQKKYQEIMDILIPKPELSESEQDILCQAIEGSEEWQKGVDVVARAMTFSPRFLQMIRTCLKKDKDLRIFREFADNLLRFAIDKCNGIAWACLLNLIVNEIKDKKEERKVTELVSTIHQFMAKKGSCTHSDGEFLLTALDFLVNRCSLNQDDLILRCFSCLYHHPPKKPGSSCLQPHSSSVKLKWENVDTIYCYFVPEELPEFDSIKSNSIDSDTEILLRKIIPLIPAEHNPMKDAKIVDDYLKLGTSLNSTFITKPHYITQNIYYFLADFYFKNKDFQKARDHYVQDLALNLNRFDSWAACALSIGKIIETTLLRGDAVARDYDKISHLADSASRCYSQALKIEPDNTKIWIEYGNLSYIVASHFSRLGKALKEKSNDEDESIKLLKQLEKKMLNQAKESFEAASNTDHEDEKWLQYYFLGKIAEKMNSLQALQYYEYSDLYLAKSGAAYPRKIDYHKPTKLSIEALEIHYRTHACALKYLKSKSKISEHDLRTIMIHLLRALRSPFVKRIRHSFSAQNDHEHMLSQENSSSQKFSRISDDVREVMEDVLGIVEFEHEKYSRGRLKIHLEEICLEAMHRCLLRFSNHYKSLYCLAHHFYSSGDYPAAKIVLLGRFTASAVHEKAFMKFSNNPPEQFAPEPITGLFAEHKSNNLFNGIWRIPVDDIDRSNSFSAHMFRSTRLLIKIASALKDLSLLSTVATQLSKTPDVGKKYMSDMDRLRLVCDAAKNCVSLLPSKLAESKMNKTPMDQRAEKVELKKVFDQLMKCNVNDEETVKSIFESRKLLQND